MMILLRFSILNNVQQILCIKAVSWWKAIIYAFVSLTSSAYAIKFSNYLFDFKIRLYSQNDMCIYFLFDMYTNTYTRVEWSKNHFLGGRLRSMWRGRRIGLNDIVENVIFVKPYICSRNLWSLWFRLRVDGF